MTVLGLIFSALKAYAGGLSQTFWKRLQRMPPADCHWRLDATGRIFKLQTPGIQSSARAITLAASKAESIM